MTLSEILSDPYILFWLGVIVFGLALRKRNDDDI